MPPHTALEQTIWPDRAIEPEVKDLIAQFFRLVDMNDESAGRQLAQHVFTKDATMITANGVFNGENGGCCLLPSSVLTR
jgi:hypothetical protein